MGWPNGKHASGVILYNEINTVASVIMKAGHCNNDTCSINLMISFKLACAATHLI